jgi:type II secretory pathway pseudopilin PulG
MMFRKLGLLIKSQKGLTMLELLMAFAVSSIITGGITMAFYEVVTGSVRTSNHMTLVKQVQQAGYWVSYDAQLVQDEPVIVKDGEQLDYFTLTWTGWDDVVNTVTYTLDGTELWRDDGVQQIPVAQFIDPAGTDVEFNDTNGDSIDDTLIFKVTATMGSGFQEQSETRVYKVVPRPR